MKRQLLLFCLLSLFFLSCKKEEKQYSLRLVVDGGRYVSSIYRIANDKRTPISVDTISGDYDITVSAIMADDLFLVRVKNLRDEAVNLKAYTPDKLLLSKTLNKGEKTFHQYFFSSESPSQETLSQFGNDYQRQIYEDQKEQQ